VSEAAESAEAQEATVVAHKDNAEPELTQSPEPAIVEDAGTSVAEASAAEVPVNADARPVDAEPATEAVAVASATEAAAATTAQLAEKPEEAVPAKRGRAPNDPREIKRRQQMQAAAEPTNQDS